MDNTIQIFNSPQFGEIRTAGTSDNPLFCLSDLCSCLGLSAKGVDQRLTKDVISNYPLETPGGIQQALFVNEDGLYDVILDSRKPQAKAFRKWITSEVLPAIRKTGGYIVSNPEESPEDIMARALIVAQQTIERHRQQLQIAQGTIERQEDEIKELAPKAQYTDEVLQSTSTYTLTQVAHDLGLRSVHALTRILMEKKILFRQSGQWQPTAKVATKGYFNTRTAKYVKTDNSVGTSISTVVTESGRQFLHNLINGRF